MIKKTLQFAIIWLLSISPLYSQHPFLFNKVNHSFGDVIESDGVVHTIFSFKNTGINPLVITSVDVTCGCTKPEYISDTIQVGDSGWIKAFFDPTGRPGEFDKNLFVVFNGNPSLFSRLTITGNVKGDVSDRINRYKYAFGNFSVSDLSFDFDEIKYDKEYSVLIKVSNEGKFPIVITKTGGAPDFFKISTPKQLRPGDTGVIEVKVHKKDLQDLWGDFRYQFMIISTDHLAPQKRFYITGKRVDDYSKLSKKELKIAPVISSSQTSVHLGKVAQGGKVSGEVIISNKGKTNLEIRNVHSPCICLKGSIDNQVIPPGGTAKLTLTYDSLLQKIGTNSRGVTLYTNDPKNPELIIYGSAEVVE